MGLGRGFDVLGGWDEIREGDGRQEGGREEDRLSGSSRRDGARLKPRQGLVVAGWLSLLLRLLLPPFFLPLLLRFFIQLSIVTVLTEH